MNVWEYLVCSVLLECKQNSHRWVLWQCWLVSQGITSRGCVSKDLSDWRILVSPVSISPLNNLLDFSSRQSQCHLYKDKDTMSQPLGTELGEALLYSKSVLENGIIAVYHCIPFFINFMKGVSSLKIQFLPLIRLRLVSIWKLWTICWLITKSLLIRYMPILLKIIYHC